MMIPTMTKAGTRHGITAWGFRVGHKDASERFFGNLLYFSLRRGKMKKGL
jgi:hypothetical protein